MIKNKIWTLTLLVFLGGLVSFTSLNQPSIAMNNEDENKNLILYKPKPIYYNDTEKERIEKKTSNGIGSVFVYHKSVHGDKDFDGFGLNINYQNEVLLKSLSIVIAKNPTFARELFETIVLVHKSNAIVKINFVYRLFETIKYCFNRGKDRVKDVSFGIVIGAMAEKTIVKKKAGWCNIL